MIENRDPAGQSERNSAPAVSVIIPAYNATAYICDALESVFAQTCTNFEVIVINDGSPDTDEFERAIAPYRRRIVYLKQENRGPSAARNAGIKYARGEYVAFLDADDAWYPTYLAEQMRILEATPSLDLIYSDLLLYTDSVSTGIPYMQKCPSKGPVTFESVLQEHCQIPTSNAVARKRAVIEAGLFDEQFWRSEDFDLWLRMAYNGAKMSYQEKLLGRHRVRSEGLSGDNVRMLEGMVQVLLKLERTLHLPLGTRALLQAEIAKSQAQYELEQGKRYLYEGKFGEAAEWFEKANRFFQRTRLRFVLIGLKIAPRLTALVAKTFQHWRFGLKSVSF